VSHFAKVNPEGIVTNVIVAEPEFFTTFIDVSPGSWVQTSYNTRGGVYYDPETGLPSADQSKALRKNYACIGFTYDHKKDAFIPPQPFPSWTLNSFSCLWEPPIPYPTDGNAYVWNETNKSWDEDTNIGE